MLVFVCFDVIYSFVDVVDFFGVFIGNFDVEFFFEGYDEFDDIERVCIEVVGEVGFGGYFVGVDIELFNDDFFDFVCYRYE